ncbi:uncharacterized protein LOC114260904 [Camellia sinensis]|uniref:uncharacterized protein LOC114260904 n=1 Tax=Camellia sinensis TaxID=4442 RepID=UPI001035C1A4|nr:uncharacterized protein LOC114260904 [Camellia sinensis]
MEMVDGMVDVDMVVEAELGEDAAVFLDVEEAMVVGICNKTWVVTMVDQGHCLLKAVAVDVDVRMDAAGAVGGGVGVVRISDLMVQSRQLPDRQEEQLLDL